MLTPLVTVIIDTYNHEQFIEQAILSVLAQEFNARDMEILVVDDGSTDNTPGVIRKFMPRVRYIYKANGGQASAFNAGIPAARGQIVAFLDGDDWWANNKLRTVLEEFEREPEIGAVGHGITEVYADGQQRTITPAGPSRIHLRTLEGALAFRMLKAFLGTSRFAARRAVLEQVLPVPEALLFEADEFVFTVTAALTEVAVLACPLTYYRLHGGNLFQLQAHDEVKLQRKYHILASLLQVLPLRLRALSIPRGAIEAVSESLWVEVEHLRLSLAGGKSWETFRVERAACRLAYKETDWGYRVFKWMTLGVALLMPPRHFYQLKRWYALHDVHRLRARMGQAIPAAPIVDKVVKSSH